MEVSKGASESRPLRARFVSQRRFSRPNSSLLELAPTPTRSGGANSGGHRAFFAASFFVTERCIRNRRTCVPNSSPLVFARERPNSRETAAEAVEKMVRMPWFADPEVDGSTSRLVRVRVRTSVKQSIEELVMKSKALSAGQYLSPRQVAEYLGVSTKTISRRIADGEIRASRIGRLLRIAAADVVRYVERNEIQTE
jgi:excisionase family DNA binding protein